MQHEWIVLDWLCGSEILDDFAKKVGGEMATVPTYNSMGEISGTRPAVKITASLDDIYERWRGKIAVYPAGEKTPVIWLTRKGFGQYG